MLYYLCLQSVFHYHNTCTSKSQFQKQNCLFRQLDTFKGNVELLKDNGVLMLCFSFVTLFNAALKLKYCNKGCNYVLIIIIFIFTAGTVKKDSHQSKCKDRRHTNGEGIRFSYI